MYNKKKYKKSRVNTDYYQMCCSYNKKIQNVQSVMSAKERTGLNL